MTLADKAVVPGIGNGAVVIAPGEVRHVRAAVMEVGDENWAARSGSWEDERSINAKKASGADIILNNHENF